MVDIRLAPSVTPNRSTADTGLINAHSTRDGALYIADWIQGLVVEGRGYMLQFGTEDAPINSTTVIDPTLVEASVDVAAGLTMIPFWGQGVVGTWQTAALINYMIEVDNGKVRRTGGGTAFTPLNLHTGSSLSSDATVFVGPDITTAAKTTAGSLEVYRESIEVNVGDVADYWPKMEYIPAYPPIVAGPGATLVHFGCTSVDMTVYGNLMWCEIPSTMVS